MTTPTTISATQTLADLATSRAGASRVFYRHGLDFCCHGKVSLEEACGPKQIDVAELIEEIERESRLDDAFERWDERALPELIEFILTRFHEPHREELPRLVAMARKVESVHAEKASCPKGLAEHLDVVARAMEEHMQKEEQVLFPLLKAGRGAMATMPIQVMEEEHREHGQNLERLRVLAHDYDPPEDACGTWRALYLGLAELESELMQHIHLENNVLFRRALEITATA